MRQVRKREQIRHGLDREGDQEMVTVTAGVGRAGPKIGRYAALAGMIMAGPARLGAVRLVAVDGPAGSGKTTFASRLVAALRSLPGPPLNVGEVHTDDLLDGWTEPVAYWPRLESSVLIPLSMGQPGGFHPYDWVAGGFAAELVEVPVPDVLVLEGVASCRAQVRSRLTVAVSVVAPHELRLARGIERDGVELRAEWVRWMAQEESHFRLDGTVAAADLCINGSPEVPHDPDEEYVLMTV